MDEKPAKPILSIPSKSVPFYSIVSYLGMEPVIPDISDAV